MEQKSSKKRIVGLVVLIILILAATALVVINPFQYIQSLSSEAQQTQSDEKVQVAVRVSTLELSELQNYIRANGNVVDPSSIDVYSEVTGTLKNLYVSIGDRVEKDQVIATVDPSRAAMVYKESEVKASASGTILALPFVVGAMISPQAPIARLGMLEELEVVMDIAERHIGSVVLGTQAELQFKAYPNKVFEGEVSRLGVALNPASRTLEVGITFHDPDRQIKSGMYPSVTLFTEHLTDVLAIPRSALLYSGRDAYVFSIDSENIARRRIVQVGLQVDDKVQIIGGLEASDRLVIEGQSLLTDGTPVRVLE